MTAPSTDRGRSSRDRIINAACELIYDRGVVATGLNEVAAVSRTGKGQLYHYFRDKPDLVLAVVHAQVDRTLQSQQWLLEQLTDADDLRAWADQAVGAHDQAGPHAARSGHWSPKSPTTTTPYARRSMRGSRAGDPRWPSA